MTLFHTYSIDFYSYFIIRTSQYPLSIETKFCILTDLIFNQEIEL